MTPSSDSGAHALSPPPKPNGCELCQRESPLTKHHLIPRTLHNKPRYQKRHSREERLTAIVWLCHPCHKHIHRLYSERELADRFTTIEALMADADIRAFVDWLATKPPGFKPKSPVRKRH
ncbi:hypothetical protein [Vreelandella lutescens]|uniref:HNH domain-containing protein n=1 Tax=Vreelandella lutescens TaxID=1602943 RepID=A0ABQ1NEA1_9GAMM|nr:hypothetical protein [Halomonas lutescens]GGC74245.1 hypothetical protein GCM10011382_00130 [Halomonas lutescens]